MHPVKHILTVDKAPRESGIYAIVCEANGKRYIGSSENIRNRLKQHVNHLRRGDGKRYLARAWAKYGELAFHFEVLELVARTRLVKAEQRWMDLYKAHDRQYGFNVRTIADRNTNVVHSAETRSKISAKLHGNVLSKQTRAKLSQQRKGVVKSAEWLAKIGVAHKGKIITSEQRAKIRAKLRGRKLSAKHKANIRAAMTPEVIARGVAKRKGRVPSAVQRERQSLAMKGRKKSEATKKRMRAAAKRRMPRLARQISETMKKVWASRSVAERLRIEDKRAKSALEKFR